LTNLEYIRLILSIPHRLVLREELGIGDGQITKFQSQLFPIISGTETVRVASAEQTPETDYDLDPDLGLITFVTAPDAGNLVDADYTWAVFSDTQIDDLLTTYNDAVSTVLQDLIRALLANADLFVKYTIGMESIDRSRALDSLQALLESLQRQSPTIGQAVIWTEADYTATGRDVPWEPFLESIPGE